MNALDRVRLELTREQRKRRALGGVPRRWEPSPLVDVRPLDTPGAPTSCDIERASWQPVRTWWAG